MSTPSRQAEIRRRRTRNEKIQLLRKRYTAAKTDSERTHLMEKLRKVSFGMTEADFLKTIQARKAK